MTRHVVNEGFLTDMVGQWFALEYDVGYERGVELFETWLREQREDAHIEALEGAISQLRLREDWLDETSDPDSVSEQGYYRGFKAARQRAQDAMLTLFAVYKNRRRFAARDGEKAQNG